jgi:hypothetical protein
VNWDDERYIRVYVRDTADWLAIGWEGRFTLMSLMRILDRAGVSDLGQDLGALPELLRMPAEIVEIGIDRLLKRRVIQINGKFIFMPNFLLAQEARQSDRMRQEDSRARRRDVANAKQAGVTIRDVPSQNVTGGHENEQEVTRGHQASHAVTDGHSVPYRTVPSRTVIDPPYPPQAGDGGAQVEQSTGPRATRAGRRSEKAHRALTLFRSAARELWDYQDQLRARAMPGTRSLTPTDESLGRVAARLEEGFTVEDCRAVLEVYAQEALRTPQAAQWFNGETNWRPENFRRALGKAGAPQPKWKPSSDQLEQMADILDMEKAKRALSD